MPLSKRKSSLFGGIFYRLLSSSNWNMDIKTLQNNDKRFTFDHLIQYHIQQNISASPSNAIVTMNNYRASLTTVAFIHLPMIQRDGLSYFKGLLFHDSSKKNRRDNFQWYFFTSWFWFVIVRLGLKLHKNGS